MLEFIKQMEIIEKAHNLDYHTVIYPTVIYSNLDPVDITDILVVIKDIDIHRYTFMDTAARDYCIELCQKMIFPYGNQMLRQGDIESLDDWTEDMEMAFRIMDEQFDYLWDYQCGKIHFKDRLFAQGNRDSVVIDKEKKGTLELEFDSYEDIFKWMIDHSAGHEDDWYDWVIERLKL